MGPTRTGGATAIPRRNRNTSMKPEPETTEKSVWMGIGACPTWLERRKTSATTTVPRTAATALGVRIS